MNIALVRQRYTAFGGAERFVSRAIQALQAQGAEVTIVTRRWEAGNDMHALQCDPFYLGNLWRDWGFARAACKLLSKEKFDLVQSHERLACCDLYRAGDGVHREWLKQRRRVLGPWGRLGLRLNPYHRYTLAAEKSMFQSPRLKAVICNSRMVRDEIREHFGLPPEMLHVIYSGIDGSAFHPGLQAEFRHDIRACHGIPQQATLFLFVGSGYQRKGLAATLHAMGALSGESHLLVVGKDKNMSSFQALATHLGVAPRVHFAGALKDVKPCYGAADMLVLPTLYDPFPNVALEALSSGLPVLTSNKSGAAEFIREGENGYFCDALDIDGIAERMRAYLDIDPAGRQRMRDAARRTVSELTLEKMGQDLLGLYQAVLGLSQHDAMLP